MGKKKEQSGKPAVDSKDILRENKKEESETELGSANAFEATEKNIDETGKEWSDEELDEWLDD